MGQRADRDGNLGGRLQFEGVAMKVIKCNSQLRSSYESFRTTHCISPIWSDLRLRRFQQTCHRFRQLTNTCFMGEEGFGREVETDLAH
jgi:hypothetical protein